MPSLSSIPARPLPAWLMLLGSAFAVGHLLAIGALVLAAPSGPWPTNFGMSSDSPGPKFADNINSNITYPHYLRHLRMTHNYHFLTNGKPAYAASFEVILKDEFGAVVRTLKFPDEKANFWVRHRQGILAQALANDQPVQPRGSEVIAAPNKKIDEVEFWDTGEDGALRLKKVAEILVPRDRTVLRPSDWAKLTAQACMRYLCREYGAASAELVRYSRGTVYPMVLIRPELLNPEEFKALKSHFGDYRREK